MADTLLPGHLKPILYIHTLETCVVPCAFATNMSRMVLSNSLHSSTAISPPCFFRNLQYPPRIATSFSSSSGLFGSKILRFTSRSIDLIGWLRGSFLIVICLVSQASLAVQTATPISKTIPAITSQAPTSLIRLDSLKSWVFLYDFFSQSFSINSPTNTINPPNIARHICKNSDWVVISLYMFFAAVVMFFVSAAFIKWRHIKRYGFYNQRLFNELKCHKNT